LKNQNPKRYGKKSTAEFFPCIPSREITYPTWGKGKTIFKKSLVWEYVSFQEGIKYNPSAS